MTIYSTEQTAIIIEAMESAIMGNNGYATVPAVVHNDWLRWALQEAGMVVIGAVVYTQHGYQCAGLDGYAIPMVKHDSLSSTLDTRNKPCNFDKFDAKISQHETNNLF